MKIHFREQYGRKGEEILYVTPAGEQIDQTDQPTTQAIIMEGTEPIFMLIHHKSFIYKLIS